LLQICFTSYKNSGLKRPNNLSQQISLCRFSQMALRETACKEKKMQVCTSEDSELTTTKGSLFTTLQPVLTPYKISGKKLMTAIEKASWDVGETEGNVQTETMSLTLWNIFSNGSPLWISPRTPAGNTITLDVLATAYALWRDAQRVAVRRGLDSVDAAEALTRVVYQLADMISDGTAPEILSIRKYLFVSYARALSRIAENAGILCPSGQEKEENPSDGGAFIDELDNGILCYDLLRTLPLKMRKAVIFRHVKGYTCKETADAVGMSRTAARKAIHDGLRKAYETCMKELKKMGITYNSKDFNKAARNDR
jgi:DNA-directed RNA polymerase specialized sigma24 family protein